MVDAFQHNDTRTNIPTQELREFVAADESAPDVMPFPRDPSLDPQLVWKGKDAQDHEDLGVPIYIAPPYGIKFGSDWQVSTRKRDVKEGHAANVTSQFAIEAAYTLEANPVLTALG